MAVAEVPITLAVMRFIFPLRVITGLLLKVLGHTPLIKLTGLTVAFYSCVVYFKNNNYTPIIPVPLIR